MRVAVQRVHLGGHTPTGRSQCIREVFRQGARYPDIAIWVSIVINLGAGLALLVGLKTHWVAGVLAILCLYTAFGVHLRVGDPASMFHFYKNLTVAGGLM